MATKLLLLLLASACTAELGFRHKQQYKYAYEAKQVSGIPALDSQFSGLGLKMTVLVQVPLADGSLNIKLTDVQFGELHNTRVGRSWRQPFTVQYQQDSQYREHFSKPFKVVMNQGVVRSFITSSGEPTWIVNIKKSVAQLLQVDIKRQASIEARSMPQPDAYQSSHAGEPAVSFRVMEHSIGGECETIYEVSSPLTDNIKADIIKELSEIRETPVHVPEIGRFRPFYVAKTKNYQNCRSRPIWQHMTPPAVACRADDCHLTGSNSSTVMRYLLDGDHSDFRIQSVVAESEALVYPFGHETEQLWTITNQTLLLQVEERMGALVGDPQQPVEAQNLTFLYPTADGQPMRFPDLVSAPQISAVMPGMPIGLIKQKMGVNGLISHIVRLVQQVDGLLEQVPKPGSPEVGGFIIEIERALGFLSYQELQQVYRQIQSAPTKKHIFLDTLAAVGTNPAVSLLIDVIRHSAAEETLYAATLIATLPMNIKTPTPQLVEQLVKLYKSAPVQNIPALRVNMALAVANIFHQVCVSEATVQFSYSQSMYGQPFCNDAMLNLMIQNVIPFLETQISAHQEPEKLAYIQALGNIGHKQIIPVLYKLFASSGPGSGSSPLAASKAIYALDYLSIEFPQLVRKMVMPIFDDQTVAVEVRLAALNTLLLTNPPITYWQKIATSTWFEPNEQIVAFVHSAFASLANNTMAQVQPLFEMSRRARITVPLVRPPQSGIVYSSSYSYVGRLISQYQVAVINRMSYITSPQSVVPSVFYGEFQHYINSFIYSTSKFVLNAQGAQSIIYKFLGGSNARQSPRDIGTASAALQRIISELGIRQPQHAQGFQASVYMQLMGAIDAFVSVNSDQYDQLVTAMSSTGSASAHFVQKIGYLVDKTVVFPAESGFPVVYVQKMPFVASVRGKISATYSYQEGKYTVDLQNVQPFVASTDRVMVSTLSPWSLRFLGVGVENNFQVSLPITIHASIDTAAKKVETSISLLEQPSSFRLAHIQTVPFTTAILANSFAPMTADPNTKEIRSSKQTTIQIPFGKAMDIRGTIQLVSEGPVLSFGAMYNEFQKRGSSASQMGFWYLMGSLRARHYDVIIDVANSGTKKVDTTFQYVNKFIPDVQAHQSIIQSRVHQQKVAQNVRSLRDMMARSGAAHQGIGVAITATTTQRSGTQSEYSSTVHVGADAGLYSQEIHIASKMPQQHVCFDAKLQFPALGESRQSILGGRPAVPVTAYLGFGEASCNESSVAMKGSVQRDETARQYATQCAEAQRCQLHERRGNPNSADCRIAKDHAAMANYYNLDFTMNHLPAYFRNASYQLDYFAKYAFWPYMSNDPYKTGTPNEMKVQIYINPNFNTMSVDVQKPFEATKYEGMVLPFNVLYGPHLLSIRKSAAMKLTDAVFGLDKTVCIVDKQVVKTFDNLAITRKPSSDCWTLLTADASGAEAVAVMEKQIGGQPAVRILAGQSDVQISAGSGSFSVKVDGRPSPLSRQQPVVVSSGSGSGSGSGGQHMTIAHIQQFADDYVKVHLPQHYMQLKVSHEGVQVYASPIVYRGKLTGVCGNMDGEHMDEMRAPQGCVFKSAEPFIQSFYVSEGGSSQQCKAHPPSSGQCVHLPQSAGTRY